MRLSRIAIFFLQCVYIYIYIYVYIHIAFLITMLTRPGVDSPPLPAPAFKHSRSLLLNTPISCNCAATPVHPAAPVLTPAVRDRMQIKRSDVSAGSRAPRCSIE